MKNTSEEIHHSENPEGSPSCNCDRPTESQQLLQTLLTEFRQYRTRRRWFWLVAVFAFIGVLGGSISLFWLDAPSQPDRFTAVIEISGVIGFDNDNSAAGLEERFQAAFNAPGCQGVIALINSPGGSPVQSGQLHRALRLLDRAHSNVPLYAVISDVGASGGYYIATAAEKIFVDPASIVGSIGVIANGFGFVDTLGKLGVERRLTTAGQLEGKITGPTGGPRVQRFGNRADGRLFIPELSPVRESTQPPQLRACRLNESGEGRLKR